MATRPRFLLVCPTFEPKTPPQQHLEVELLLAFLRGRGFSAEAIDAQAAELDAVRLAETVENRGAEIVYLHAPSRVAFCAARAAAEHLRAPHGLLVLGGDFASARDMEILARTTPVDAVLRGELEPPMDAQYSKVQHGRRSRA
jgi:hypothetical protein